jgi:hypothetical protein
LSKGSKNSPRLLNSEVAEYVYGTMMWNKVDRIVHKAVVDEVTKFGDDCTQSQHILGDFLVEKEQKTRHTSLNLTLLSVRMGQWYGIKLIDS